MLALLMSLMLHVVIFREDTHRDDDDQVKPQNQNSRLWVDLYSPKSYIDLMSDEVTLLTTTAVYPAAHIQFYSIIIIIEA